MVETSNVVARPRPGAVLRQIRIEHGWTLQDVSRRTGLTVSALSKIENDKLALTYDKMVRIATGLKIDIGVLFAAPERAPPKPSSDLSLPRGRRSVTRAGEGRLIETATAVQHYPAADLLNKQLVPIICEIKARSREALGDLLRHPGEEYVLVLEGSMDLHSEFYAPVRLDQGDSIYFDSNMAHGYVAVGESQCRILSVCSTVDWGEAAAGADDAAPPYLQLVRAS